MTLGIVSPICVVTVSGVPYVDDFVLTFSIIEIDWRHAFTERIWAERFMIHHAQPLQPVYPQHIQSSDRSILYPIEELGPKGDPETHHRLLTAILDVIAAVPALPPRHRVHISQALTDLPRLHAHTPITPPSLTIPQSCKSLKVTWLEKILVNGFPFSLTRLIS